MDVVPGIDALAPEHGPAFVVVGVFDGLHLGHRYLLDHLVAEADKRDAKPMVITFDHHPDEILTGTAPPLLLDPEERLERLAASGVEVTVVQHFDAALRQTPYDVFVERIRARLALKGFLMTPDAAFGFERRGTPETLAALGSRRRVRCRRRSAVRPRRPARAEFGHPDGDRRGRSRAWRQRCSGGR